MSPCIQAVHVSCMHPRLCLTLLSDYLYHNHGDLCLFGTSYQFIYWKEINPLIDRYFAGISILIPRKKLYLWAFRVENPRGRRNIKMSSYKHRDPRVKDKTVSRHGNPHTWERRSLYWAQISANFANWWFRDVIFYCAPMIWWSNTGLLVSLPLGGTCHVTTQFSHDIMTYMCIPVKLPWIFLGAQFLMISWHTCAYLSSCPGYFREPRFSWYHDIHVHTCQVALDISGSPVDFQRAPWNIQGNSGMHASMDSCKKDVTPLLTLPEYPG